MPPSDSPYQGKEVANPCRPTVVPEWTDYNDHFNVAYYAQAFDLASRSFRSSIAAVDGVPFRTRRSRIDYLREIPGGAMLTLTTQILSADGDGLHLLQAIYAGEGGYLAAIEERIEVPYDPQAGSERPLDGAVLQAFSGLAAHHAGLPVPPGWGGLKVDSR